jgi:hypothetical protein
LCYGDSCAEGVRYDSLSPTGAWAKKDEKSRPETRLESFRGGTLTDGIGVDRTTMAKQQRCLDRVVVTVFLNDPSLDVVFLMLGLEEGAQARGRSAWLTEFWRFSPQDNLECYTGNGGVKYYTSSS